MNHTQFVCPLGRISGNRHGDRHTAHTDECPQRQIQLTSYGSHEIAFRIIHGNSQSGLHRFGTQIPDIAYLYIEIPPQCSHIRIGIKALAHQQHRTGQAVSLSLHGRLYAHNGHMVGIEVTRSTSDTQYRRIQIVQEIVAIAMTAPSPIEMEVVVCLVNTITNECMTHRHIFGKTAIIDRTSGIQFLTDTALPLSRRHGVAHQILHLLAVFEIGIKGAVDIDILCTTLVSILHTG